MNDLSVVTPCYNAGELLQALADCMASQTLKNHEWIIVDDGSAAETQAVLSRIETRNDLNVKVYRQPHQGGNFCRNYGFSQSSGKFIKFLDADDYIDKTLLQHQYETALGNPDAIVVSPTVLVKMNGVEIKRPMPSDNIEDALADYLLNDWSSQCACLIPKFRIDAVNGWDESLRFAQDLDFLRRLFLQNPPIVSDHRSNYYFRQHTMTERLSTPTRNIKDKYEAQVQSLDNLAGKLEELGRLPQYRALLARNYDRWACSAALWDKQLSQQIMSRAKAMGQGGYPIYGGRLFKCLRKILGFYRAARVAHSPLLQKLFDLRMKLKST